MITTIILPAPRRPSLLVQILKGFLANARSKEGANCFTKSPNLFELRCAFHFTQPKHVTYMYYIIFARYITYQPDIFDFSNGRMEEDCNMCLCFCLAQTDLQRSPKQVSHEKHPALLSMKYWCFN